MEPMNSTVVPRHYPLDAPFKAAAGRLTHGLSPTALTLSLLDWWLHLASSPGKQAELAQSAGRKWLRWATLAAGGRGRADAVQGDRRFAPKPWAQPPFDALADAFLLAGQWWSEAVDGVPGVSRHHEQVAAFVIRQWLDMASPSNLPWANPEVLEATWRTGGLNLWDGAANWWRDAMLVASNSPPPGAEGFTPGEHVAITPGRVVFRNALIEVIQYAPSTHDVHPEPILIVPSWIMKYYILDLSPHNSLVRYLVSQGHTVFMVSWRNPGPEDRNLGMDDYLRLGALAAVEAVQQAQPGRGIHLAGYCLGGTLAAIAAASMASRPGVHLKTLTLLAAQTDFDDPGELGTFIDEGQVAFLEDIMDDQGVLDGRQMAGAFALINSKDLVWSKLVRAYLLGGSTPLNDLHAWNADATRMPARMHSEYLRRLYLGNDLAEGRYRVDGHRVMLRALRLPIFALATERDHVSPWRSVYKIHFLTHAEVTFALTSGGHNAGIVNPPRAPAPPSIRYRCMTRSADAAHIDADWWLHEAPVTAGSWWPAWQAWLAAHSGPPGKPLPIGGSGSSRLRPLEDAPGTYVHAS
jgi:polyhydroxyalkanoate synthase